LGALSNIALNPGLYDKLSYDPLRDFVPIGLAVTWSYTLLARKLAVSSAERQPMHPEVPSIAETGVAALDKESWFGLFAPAAVPAPTLARLRAELAKVLADPEVAALFAKTGGRLLTLSPAETEALLKRDVERAGPKLIREAGISASQ
jgi:tripartite-type tricarboxylate transporter receptor subunit TctC